MSRVLLALLTLAGGAAAAGDALIGPLAGSGGEPPPPWHAVGLPQQSKPATRFQVVELDGRRVLRVEADASYGNLVHPLPEETRGHRLRWSWRLDEPNPHNDLRRREGDDSPVKVCALFDMPMGAVPFVERQILRLARLRSGEPLPAASVCYVWDSRLAAGTMLDNAFTRRVRMVVLRGPEAPLHRWADEQRDLDADFHRLFGDESAAVPPLLGIAVAGDADNTRAHSVAHLRDLALD